jgi:hypothetical protein
MDARELTGLAAPLQQAMADMSDPRQHFAWALLYFPSPNPQMGEVPIHPTARPGLSELLSSLGFEHNPEKQTKWFIPGDHPEAGYLNIPKLVDAAEHQRYMAEHADPEAENEQWRETAEALLGKLDPKLLARIEAMTPEQKAAAASVMAKDHVPAAFERLADLKKQMDGSTE